MKFKAVIFDLDGTLLNTLTDIAESANLVLARLGFPTHEESAYRDFVGHGLRELAISVLPKANRDDATVEGVAEQIAKEYSQRSELNTVPYPGVGKLLDSLTERGIRMAILTNKPQDPAEQVVAASLPGWSFEAIIGAKPSSALKPDPASALQIARDMKISPAEFLYLGDSDTDMQTAKAAGMYPVGAAWGYRSEEILRTSGAKALIHKPSELLKLFIQSPIPG